MAENVGTIRLEGIEWGTAPAAIAAALIATRGVTDIEEAINLFVDVADAFHGRLTPPRVAEE